MDTSRELSSYALSNRLSSFSVVPTATTFQGLKRIARYLGTHPHKPFFYPQNDQGHYEETQILNYLECFQDAGLTHDLTDRRSMAAMFYWKTGACASLAHSNTDAELCSMFTVVKITQFVRAFMMHIHIGYGPPERTCHHDNNQPSIDNIASANQVTIQVLHIHIPVCYLDHQLDCGYSHPGFLQKDSHVC
jgi:hypothetical protein